MFNYKYGGKVDLRSQSWYVKPEKELLESREQAGRDLLSLFGTETTTNNLVDKGYLSLAFNMVGAPNEGTIYIYFYDKRRFFSKNPVHKGTIYTIGEVTGILEGTTYYTFLNGELLRTEELEKFKPIQELVYDTAFNLREFEDYEALL